MCGIVGVIRGSDSELSRHDYVEVLENLLIVSQSRGKDSSGLALAGEQEIKICKAPFSAFHLIRSAEFRKIMRFGGKRFGVIGHARMETDGTFSKPENNHPIIKDGIVTIHNGIIVNHKHLWEKHGHLKKQYDVDTEIINALIRMNLEKGLPPAQAMSMALSELKGSYSLGILFEDLNYLFLGTNNGSLYYLHDRENSFFAFASEKRFIESLFTSRILDDTHNFEIVHLEPGSGLFVNLKTLERSLFSIYDKEAAARLRIEDRVPRTATLVDINTRKKNQDRRLENSAKYAELEKLVMGEYERDTGRIDSLRRCTKCLLPETMPFIRYDEQGVCNYCHNYQTRELMGQEKLEKVISRFRRGDGKPDCILSFSGGRDSSYALHYVKKELGLTPLAYSYDWGMLTDLGRRNQARMTGQLGVEHVLVSADIQRKRKYIRRNVLAWLKKPHIGMVPLFMAGDKQYFYFLNDLREKTGIENLIYANNILEKTDFKYGYANVGLASKEGKTYDIGLMNSFKLLYFYLHQYLTNPRYLNSSLIDTFTAYVSSYFIPKDYVYLFKYIMWDEKEIEDTLINEYDWEVSPDTKTTWRIGDGTASFYNYIYYTVTGLTENDTFRSNQIREGDVDRTYAMERARIDNRPRVDSIMWYCNTIGIDPVDAIKQINRMKKLYEPK